MKNQREPETASAGGAAHQDSPECWCRPVRYRLCVECNSVTVKPGGHAERRLGVDCWKCGGHGVLPIEYGDFVDDHEPVLLMHK